MINIKPIRFYFTFIIITVAIFTWATWKGYAFYHDKVEKNTEYDGSGSQSGHINRFYHK